MAIDVQRAVELMKQRKNMLPGITQLDDYMTARVEAAIGTLEAHGIHLVNTPADLMFVVDVAVWEYNNRDSSGAEPEWLRAAKNERWANDRSINEKYAASQLAEVNGNDH